MARTLTITLCCGESFCHACIADIQEQGRPCPECGEKDYNIVGQVKNRKRISCLQVDCSMKERGCDWSGTVEQLDTHLDPDQDNCQYMDTNCPLNCHMTIPKNEVEQHVAQHCAKRPYVCQYCSFKTTYEEVVDKHLPECKYVPLQCPNLCGVTFERNFMEDHMKMCHLEEVRCEFSGVGCDGRFRREDQEEHTRQNSQKHLTLTASLAVDTEKKLHKKLLEQEKNQKEEKQKLFQVIQEQEKKLNHQEKKLAIHYKEHKEVELKLKQRIDKQEKKMEEQREELEQHLNMKLQELEQTLLNMTVQNGVKMSKLSSLIYLNRRFEMNNFSLEKGKDTWNNWKSPSMYTHACGYKFCIGVDANGYDSGRWKSICVDLFAMSGEFDDQLKWPAKALLTIELINQRGGENVRQTMQWIWSKPTREYYHLGQFKRTRGGFVEHSKINSFLNNDTLYFYVSEVIV